ncbi:MAG: hypothetical protein ABI229_13085 [Gemmatimonadaceae bacterium]
MKIAGITAHGSHDLPLPAVAMGNPGAVETNNGGPSSTTGAGGVAVASCGTGTTDCSVGVPCASGASGRTGRHITIVVERAGAACAAFGVVRLTRCTSGRRRFTIAFSTGFGAATGLDAEFRGAATRRRLATGFFFANAGTGEHSTSESTDAKRTAGFWAARGVVSRLTTWPPIGGAAVRQATKNVASAPIVNSR